MGYVFQLTIIIVTLFYILNGGRTNFTGSSSRRRPRIFFDPFAVECYLNFKGTNKVLHCPRLTNDPAFHLQWHLVPRPEPLFSNQLTVDLGILEVWVNYGFFGQDIVVVINDVGIETAHPDLKSNYDPQFGWDFCDNQTSPEANPPGILMNSPDDHGTLVAGIIAMEMNNGLHGVGIAPQVTLGAVRFICRSINNNRLYKGNPLQLDKMDQIHITINSYSTDRSMEGNKIPLGIKYNWLYYFEETLIKGRGGLGTIHVFSTTPQYEGFTCAFDKHTQNYATISVAASNPWGGLVNHSGKCANIMVTAPVAPDENQAFFFTTNIGGGFITAITGNSFAVPIVGSIIALTLNANPRLTWRDVYHSIISTSSKNQLDHSVFIKNGAGFYASHEFGFGLINALRMVETAFQFQSVPAQIQCLPSARFYKAVGQNVYSQFSDGCKGTSNEINYLEHVKLYVNFSYFNKWSDLRIILISPHGTKAILLDEEINNNSTETELEWEFYSLITWGESPVGDWIMQIYDSVEYHSFSGNLHNLILTLYGTRTKPSHYP